MKPRIHRVVCASMALLLGGCGADCLRDTDCNSHSVCSGGQCVVAAAATADGGVRTASTEQGVGGNEPSSSGSGGTTDGTLSTPARGNLDASLDAENPTSAQ